MVGGSRDCSRASAPILATMGSEVTLCGGVGAGQVVKLMNNMVVFETTMAIAEAISIAEASGVDGRLLYETMAKGSADSFVLRNHGMKHLLPQDYPTQAFSVRYAKKDLSYARELAARSGVNGARRRAHAPRCSRRRSRAATATATARDQATDEAAIAAATVPAPQQGLASRGPTCAFLQITNKTLVEHAGNIYCVLDLYGHLVIAVPEPQVGQRQTARAGRTRNPAASNGDRRADADREAKRALALHPCPGAGNRAFHPRSTR